MTQQDYEILANCIEYNEDRKACFIKDNTPKEIAEIVRTAIFDTGEPLDLAYTIADAGLGYLGAITLSELQNPDFEINHPFEGFASIYTAERLAYLNAGNEADISQAILGEGCNSIADACACWFDHMVEGFIYNIREQIINQSK